MSFIRGGREVNGTSALLGTGFLLIPQLQLYYSHILFWGYQNTTPSTTKRGQITQGLQGKLSTGVAKTLTEFPQLLQHHQWSFLQGGPKQTNKKGQQKHYRHNITVVGNISLLQLIIERGQVFMASISTHERPF